MSTKKQLLIASLLMALGATPACSPNSTQPTPSATIVLPPAPTQEIIRNPPTRRPTITSPIPTNTPSPAPKEIIYADYVIRSAEDVFWSADSQALILAVGLDADGKGDWQKYDLLSGELAPFDPFANLSQELWRGVEGNIPYDKINPLNYYASLSPSHTKILIARQTSASEPNELIQLSVDSGTVIPISLLTETCAEIELGPQPAFWSLDETKVVILCGQKYGPSFISLVDFTARTLDVDGLDIGYDTVTPFNLSSDGKYYAFYGLSNSISIINWKTRALGKIENVPYPTVFAWKSPSELLYVAAEGAICDVAHFEVINVVTGNSTPLGNAPVINRTGKYIKPTCFRPFKISPNLSSYVFMNEDGLYVIRDLP